MTFVRFSIASVNRRNSTHFNTQRFARVQVMRHKKEQAQAAAAAASNAQK